MKTRFEWQAWLIRKLGGVERTTRPRYSFVVDAEMARGEEVRVDRLGVTEDDIKAEQPGWQPPAGAMHDPRRPTSTLGPF